MAGAWRRCSAVVLALTIADPALADGFDILPDISDIVDDLPPVNTNGLVSYSYQQQKPATGAASMTHISTATLSPSTYIYAPWLATLDSSISFSDSRGTGPTAQTVTGSLELNVLPISAYPTTLSYSRYDMNSAPAEGGLADRFSGDTAQITSRMALPYDVEGAARLSAVNTQNAQHEGASTKQADLSFDKAFVKDYLTIDLSHRDTQYTSAHRNGGGTADFNTMLLDYRLQPLTSLSSQLLGSMNLSDSRMGSNSLSDFNVQSLSISTWRPQDFRGLSVTGVVRAATDQTTAASPNGASQDNTVRSAFVNLSANQMLSDRLLASVGVNSGLNDLTLTRKGALVAPGQIPGNLSETRSDMSYATYGNLSYSSTPAEVAGFRWVWLAGDSGQMAGTSGSGASGGSTSLSDTAIIGQSASRKVGLPLLGDADLSLMQQTGAAVSTLQGESVPINHSVTLGQSMSDEDGWGSWYVSGSDNRSFGGIRSTYQLANLQLSAGWILDRYSSISATATYQLSRQTVMGTNTAEDNLIGQLSYRQSALFGEDGLVLTSDLLLNPPKLIADQRQRDFAQLTGTQPQQSSFGAQRWFNRISYLIGMTSVSLYGEVDHDQTGVSESLLFQLTRQF